MLCNFQIIIIINHSLLLQKSNLQLSISVTQIRKDGQLRRLKLIVIKVDLSKTYLFKHEANTLKIEPYFLYQKQRFKHLKGYDNVIELMFFAKNQSFSMKKISSL